MKREKLITFRGKRTQEAMTKSYGVIQQAWCQWETGAKTSTVLTMKWIEQESGIPMEEIFSDVFDNLKLSGETA